MITIDADTWAAVTEILDIDPIVEADGNARCPHCDALWRQSWVGGWHIDHTPRCPWLRLSLVVKNHPG